MATVTAIMGTATVTGIMVTIMGMIGMAITAIAITGMIGLMVGAMGIAMIGTMIAGPDGLTVAVMVLWYPGYGAYAGPRYGSPPNQCFDPRYGWYPCSGY